MASTVAGNSFVSQQHPGNLHSANLQSQSQGFRRQNSTSSVPSTASFDPPNGSIANTGSQKHHPMSSQQSQPPASQQSFSMSQTGSQPQPSQSSFRSYSDQNVPQQPQEASPIYTVRSSSFVSSRLCGFSWCSRLAELTRICSFFPGRLLQCRSIRVRGQWRCCYEAHRRF